MLTPASILLTPDPWNEYVRRTLVDAAFTEDVRRELARRDLLEYIRYFTPDYVVEPFHRFVCQRIMSFLDRIIKGEDPCLIIEAPPRRGKSCICSENLPTFAMGYLHANIPRTEILHLGYSTTFIEKFGRKNRDRFLDPRYQNLFPECVANPEVASISETRTISNGSYIASGMGATVTGLGAHLLLIDDPVQGIEEAQSVVETRKQIEAYMANISTRAMDRCGKLLIMTRWSVADLAGHLQRVSKENPEADQWEVLSFPDIAMDNDILGRAPGEALCPLRFPLKRLIRERAGKSPRIWSAMHQQCPVPESGGFFSADDITAAITPLAKYPPIKDLTIYVPGDFAVGRKARNDFTVFWPFGVDQDNHIWFLNDCRRFRGGGNEIITAIIDLIRKYTPRSLILEDGHIYRGIADALADTMRAKNVVAHIDAPYPMADKTARAEPLRARLQQHLVHFPDTPFMKDTAFVEFMAFGVDSVGVHDDIPDACATGLLRLSHLQPPSRPKTTKSTPEDPDSWTMDRIKALHTSQSRRFTRHGVHVPPLLNGKPRPLSSGTP